LKLLIATLIIFVNFLFSCEAERATIKEIYLPDDLNWGKIDIGVSHIDSTRKQVYTDLFILYGDVLVYGDAPIDYYLDIDSISITYEAGMIEYRYLNCIKLERDIYDTLTLSGSPLYFEKGEGLVYANKTYISTDIMFLGTVKDLERKIGSDIEDCNK